MTVTTQDVLQAVELVTGVCQPEIKSDSRCRASRRARLLVYFVSNQCFNESQSEVARVMGKSQSTVNNVMTRLLSETVLDPELVDRVEATAELIAASRQLSEAA